MTYVKQYIHFLFAVGLCFHSSRIVSSEFGYIPVPGSQNVTEVSKDISTIVTDNPAVVTISAATLLVGSFFLGRGKIYDWAKQRYECLQRDVKNQITNAHKEVERKTSSQTRILMSALKPLLGGIPNYLSYNKWHMVVATLATFAGHFLGHPWIGAGLGGTTLTAGYFNQGFEEIRDDIKLVREDIQQLDEKNAGLHAETQAKVDGIADKIKKLSKKIETTQEAIEKEIKGLEVTMSIKIEGVDNKLDDLNGNLKDVPQQILGLMDDLKSANKDLATVKSQNNMVIEHNKKMVQQTEALSQQLTETTSKFVSTQQQFDTLGKILVKNMKEMAIDTKKQLDGIRLQTGKQAENLVQINNDVNHKFETLFENVATNSRLLNTIKDIQASDDQQLAILLSKMSDSEQHDQKTSITISEIMSAQAASARNCAAILQDLNDIRNVNNQNFDILLPKMEVIDSKLAEFGTRMIGVETQLTVDKKKRKELKKIITGQSDLIANLSTQIFKLQGHVTDLREQIGENNRLVQHTNLLAQNAVVSIQNSPSTGSVPLIQNESDIIKSLPEKRFNFSQSRMNKSLLGSGKRGLALPESRS